MKACRDRTQTRKRQPAVQPDLFLPLCSTCEGRGRRMHSVTMPKPGKYRLRALPVGQPLRKGQLPIVPPDSPGELWGRFRLVAERVLRSGEKGSVEYVRCERCLGSGKLDPAREREWQRFQSWLRGDHAF